MTQPAPDTKWRRPPTKYEEDEEANADSYLLFQLLDKDLKAYLSLQDVFNFRQMITSRLSSEHAHMLKAMHNPDENNDGKVVLEEWHDFLRSLYELLGKRRWQQVIAAWRHVLSEARRIQQEKEEAAKAHHTQSHHGHKGDGGQGGTANVQGNHTHHKHTGVNNHTNEASQQSLEEEAATRIQACFHGKQTRKSLDEKHQHKTHHSHFIHDHDKVKMAKDAGRHFIKVISGDAEHGNRADFFLDGDQIEFTKNQGDFGRGLLVVTIDPDSGEVTSRNVYFGDADASSSDVKADCERFASDIERLATGQFVLVANKAYGLECLNRRAVAALWSVGADCEDLGKREVSYALIGCKGCLASTEHHGEVAEAEAFVSFSPELRAQAIEGVVPRHLGP